jgi:hypothetical protein
MQQISKDERVLLALEPDVPAEPALPDKVCVLEDDIVDIDAFSEEVNLLVLFASVVMLLDSLPPAMHLLD